MNVVKCDLGSICDFVFDLACERERERERKREKERERERKRETLSGETCAYKQKAQTHKTSKSADIW